MGKSDFQIFQLFTDRVQAKFPEARIWAYGSRARGQDDWDSDFDICIVLDEVNKETYHIIREIAWEVGFGHDRVITTLIFTKDDFERGPSSESTLVMNILQEGLRA